MEKIYEKQLQDLMESLQQYIAKIPSGSNKIAELLREGNNDSAYKAIGDFVEGMEWVTSSLRILSENNYVITFDSEQLNKLLLELNDALTKQDEGLISDLFDYEIADFFEVVGRLEIIKTI